MMTKSTSIKVSVFKKLALIPIFAFVAFVFSTTVTAQDTSKVISQEKKQKDSTQHGVVGISPGSTKNGVSQELLNEYQNIIDKYKTGKNFGLRFSQIVTATDKSRLEKIFKQMSKEQQRMQTVGFIKNPPPLPKITPTKSQIESFKNSRQYGVWINEKKVSNTTLNNYTNTDFSQVFVSKLSKNAINYGEYYYQVNMMTKDYYQKYYDEAIANKDKAIMVINHVQKLKDK